MKRLCLLLSISFFFCCAFFFFAKKTNAETNCNIYLSKNPIISTENFDIIESFTPDPSKTYTPCQDGVPDPNCVEIHVCFGFTGLDPTTCDQPGKFHGDEVIRTGLYSCGNGYNCIGAAANGDKALGGSGSVQNKAYQSDATIAFQVRQGGSRAVCPWQAFPMQYPKPNCTNSMFKITKRSDGSPDYVQGDAKLAIDTNGATGFASGGVYNVVIEKRDGSYSGAGPQRFTANGDGTLPAIPDIDMSGISSGDYVVKIKGAVGGLDNAVYCGPYSFSISNQAGGGITNGANPFFNLCAQIPASVTVGGESARKKCCDCEIPGSVPGQNGSCDGGSNNGAAQGVWTAVGCIQTDKTNLIQSILQLGLGIAGGAAMLMIIIAGAMLTLSQGEPKRATEARELLTSAVVGLIFIILSITILQFIGVNILRIPGFVSGITGS